MEDTKIQWHPGFVAAMDMEFKEDREKLEFESEHNLNRKPLEIDLLVIKKEKDAELGNEIGKIFKGHNIMEYKSPRDQLDIDTFYKVSGYASLYKSYGKTVDCIKAEDVTISLLRESRPRELFNYFKRHNVEVEMPYNGIYYIKGISPFPAQVIVIKELGKEGHMWIKALTEKMEKADLEKLIEKSGEFSGEYDRKLVESILEVALNANLDLVEELRGDEKMGDIMLKIMQPAILEIEKSAEIRGKKAGIEEGRRTGMEEGRRTGMEEGRRTGMEEGKIIGAIEILRNFKSNDDVKKIIMEKYKLTENDVEKYL